MSDLEKTRILLTHAQMVRALKGRPIHLSPSQITEQQNTDYGLVLNRDHMKTLRKARINKRGFRVQLTQPEIDATAQWAQEIEGRGLSGGQVDWKKIGRQLRRGAREAVPIVKSGVKTALKKAYEKGDIEKGLTAASTLGFAGLATYMGRPDLAPYAYVPGAFTGKVLTETGHKLGAYGVEKSSDDKLMDTPKRRHPITTKPVKVKAPKPGKKGAVLIALPPAPAKGKGIKSAFKKLHKLAKPALKKVAHMAVKEAVKALPIPDKMKGKASDLAIKGADYLAKETGAYGMYRGERGGYGMYRGSAKGMYRGRGEGMKSGKGRCGYGFVR